jgi:hypothetical protein
MLQASAQAVDFKVGRYFGEGQVLPYELDTPASFSFAAFNGRGLSDDVMDVILTLATNTALGDGVAPDQRLMRPDFPYFGEPHATAANSAKQ